MKTAIGLATLKIAVVSSFCLTERMATQQAVKHSAEYVIKSQVDDVIKRGLYVVQEGDMYRVLSKVEKEEYDACVNFYDEVLMEPIARLDDIASERTVQIESDKTYQAFSEEEQGRFNRYLRANGKEHAITHITPEELKQFEAFEKVYYFEADQLRNYLKAHNSTDSSLNIFRKKAKIVFTKPKSKISKENTPIQSSVPPGEAEGVIDDSIDELTDLVNDSLAEWTNPSKNHETLSLMN